MLGIAIFQKAVIMLKIMPALSADDYPQHNMYVKMLPLSRRVALWTLDTDLTDTELTGTASSCKLH